MAMDDRKISDLKKDIDVRINKQLQQFANAYKNGKSPEELHLMFENFISVLNKDKEKYVDEDLKAYFLRKEKQLYGMEIVTYGKYFDFFQKCIRNRESAISQKYNKWIHSLNDVDLNLLTKEYKSLWYDAKFYENILKDNERAKNKFLNSDALRKEIDNVNSFLEEYTNEINKVLNDKTTTIDNTNSNSDEVDNLINSKNTNDNVTNKEKDISRPNDLSVEEYNKYLALSGTIDDYIGAIEAERGNILNVAIEGNSSLYEKYSRELNVYIAELKGLSKKATNASENFDTLNDGFRKIREIIKDKFKYDYKMGVKNRKRKVIRVKKLALGIGGFAIGALGISRLISRALVYMRFGVIFGGISPFIGPSLIVILGAFMLKKALSSNEKSVVKTFISKLSDKFKRRRSIDDIELNNENDLSNDSVLVGDDLDNNLIEDENNSVRRVR